MEGKKSVAVRAASLLIVLLLLSGQPPQVSGLCLGKCLKKCFERCYSICRERDHYPRVNCNLRCIVFCGPGQGRRESEEVAAAPSFAGVGSGSKEKDSLLASGGGVAATGGGNDTAAGPAGADVAACVHGCTGYGRRMKAKRA